jgi:quercetin dioxygenase-like cupin family protein
MPDSTAPETTTPFPGLTRRILSCTADSMLVEHHMEPNSVFPWHSHVHEQTVFVLEGNLEVWTRATPEEAPRLRTAKAGDSWVVASNVEHRVHALSAARVLDFFTPYREDYLPAGHPLEIRR